MARYRNAASHYLSEWVIKFNGLSEAADSEVDKAHISRVFVANILESLSSLT